MSQNNVEKDVFSTISSETIINTLQSMKTCRREL